MNPLRTTCNEHSCFFLWGAGTPGKLAHTGLRGSRGSEDLFKVPRTLQLKYLGLAINSKVENKSEVHGAVVDCINRMVCANADKLPLLPHEAFYRQTMTNGGDLQTDVDEARELYGRLPFSMVIIWVGFSIPPTPPRSPTLLNSHPY